MQRIVLSLSLLLFVCSLFGQSEEKKKLMQPTLEHVPNVVDPNGKQINQEKIFEAGSKNNGASDNTKQNQIRDFGQNNKVRRAPVGPDSFESYKKKFLDKLWDLNPAWASRLGNRNYDDRLFIPSYENYARKMSEYKKLLRDLGKYKKEEMGPLDAVDHGLIKNFLLESIWEIERFKAFEWDPSIYNVGGAFDAVINNKTKSNTEKVIALNKKMELVPEFYKQARINLKNATIEHTTLAIRQVNGSLDIFENQIPELLKSTPGLDGRMEQVNEKRQACVNAIKGYKNWLENTYLPKMKNGNARDFRIGKELYRNKFKYQINAGKSADEVFQAAEREMLEVQEKMFVLAKELWPKYGKEQSFPKDKNKAIRLVIDEISKQHTSKEAFITTIKNQIPELEAFVTKKNLVEMDPTKPLKVRKTPAYMAGVAGASISAPGPYDKKGETYYNVSPLDRYSDEEAESYLREYNDYMLQILNIHEAIPGHYTQLVYANKAPSLIKSILSNGTMVEGWACYAERMMLEEGYGENQPELWIMYYKWLLRIISNSILDYSIHNLDMTEAEAMDLLINQAFQEKTEARGKWQRAKLTSVQLCSYYTGLRSILDLREEYYDRKGDDLRAFHDQFLSYGSAPVQEIRTLMLR